MNQTAVMILVGGKGTRLSRVVSDRPKPLAPIGEYPLIEFILTQLDNQAFRNIFLLSGHMGEKFDYLETKTFRHLAIRNIKEKSPLGTGGAVKNAFDTLDLKSALILNGDTYLDLQWSTLAVSDLDESRILLGKKDGSERYGSVDFDPMTLVVKSFKEKSAKGTGYINFGAYFLSKNDIQALPIGYSSLEKDLLPELAQSGKLLAVLSDCKFIDIGIPTDYQEAKRLIPEWQKAQFSLME